MTGLGLGSSLTPKTIVHNDQGTQESNCGMAPPLHGHGASGRATIRIATVRLSIPHIFCVVANAPIPKRKIAREINVKNAMEA